MGVICSCTGSLGSAQVPIEDVYRAWINSVNVSGGIDGHQIQLVAEDDGGTPGTALSDAQTLISDHVVAIADMSIVDTAWASAVQAAKIPVVGVGIPNVTFFENPDFFPEGQTADSTAYAVAAAAKASGAKSLGILYCAEAVVCEQLVPTMKAEGKAMGIPVVFSASISATAPDYTAQCVAAKQAHVGALAIFDESPEIIHVGQDCNLQDYNPVYVTEGASFGENLVKSSGIKDLWSEYADLPFWATNPSVQAMDAAVDKYYPGLRSNDQVWYEDAAMAWPSGILLEDAIKAGGLTASAQPSSTEVVDGLNSLHGDTLDGWSPPLTFSAGSTHKVDCWFIGSVQGGTTSLADNGQTTCQSGS